jgi:excisionase family DNA binding protein
VIQPRYLTANDVCAYVGCSRSQIAVLVKAGRLPAPIRLTGRMVRWDREAIDALLSPPPKSGVVSADDAIQEFVRDQQARRRPRRHQAAERRLG